MNGRVDEAGFLYSRAIAIGEKTWPADDPFLIMVLTEYADLLLEQNRTEEAQAIEARIPPGSRTTAATVH